MVLPDQHQLYPVLHQVCDAHGAYCSVKARDNRINVGIQLNKRKNVNHASRLVDSGLTGNYCKPIPVGLILRSP